MPIENRRFSAPPPLSLYVHLPWCERKCPYCDFNSHTQRGSVSEATYVGALLRDLDAELECLESERRIDTIFIGGGTPSLFSGESIERLIDGIRARSPVAESAEVTLEANPGTVDAAHFARYAAAGVNRLSIGIQSMAPEKLAALGRIHRPIDAILAVDAGRDAGISNINVDLMFGLPGQTLRDAADDLEKALALEPPHLSYYQLTIEPNTAFFRAPPRLPDHDLADAIHRLGLSRLAAAGHRRYEVSAFSRPGRHCRHNLNYWQFGDYLGIGAGAHGKVTQVGSRRVSRRTKVRRPEDYVEAGDQTSSVRSLTDQDLIEEFFLNALRLVDGVTVARFTERTGLDAELIAPSVERAVRAGLLERFSGRAADRIRPTRLGFDFLNDLIAGFVEPV